MTFDSRPTSHSLDAALADYEHATNTAGEYVSNLLGIEFSSVGEAASTLRDLREQAAVRVNTGRRQSAVLSAPAFDPATALFPRAQSVAARFLLRAANRRAHELGFTARDEIMAGEMAVAAVRFACGGLSPLADRLAWADHVASNQAVATLGKPLNVHRDFVIRCAVLGLGDALNTEHDPDVPASVAVEAWLGEARSRYQRR
jgi:hypothetical protein